MSARLVVISPVRDEAATLPLVARSLEAQTRLPERWLIVDDGSTDATREIARELERRLPWVELLEAPPAVDSDQPAQRLAEAAEALAFNRGLEAAGDFTHVAKLDGDVELPPDFLERSLDAFAREPRLGIAGGDLVEPVGGGWRLLAVPEHHAHGGLRIYSRECLEAVGGVREQLGWDTIDLTYARMQGFETRLLPGPPARHHRPWGSSGGRLRGFARYGECAYIVRYGLPWVAARSVKVAATRPYGLSGAAFLAGYLRAAVSSRERVEDERFRRFVRAELRARMAGGRKKVPAQDVR
jgi:glycosyltransferase involved in cell wall biosynthesis